MAQKRKTAILKAPDQVEREYTRILQWLVRQIVADTRRIVLPKLAGISKEYQSTLKQDGYSDDLVIMLAALLDQIAQSTRVVELRLPALFALMARNNDRALIMAVKASTGQTLPPAIPGAPKSLLGVSLYRAEPWLADMQEAWVRQNVALVKSIGTKYHDDLETIIRNGVFNGSSVKQVSDQIQAKFGVTKNRATLIAQDQVLSANSRLTQIRAMSIGVTSYIWESVGDSRVRPLHVELTGKEFTWENPHPTEGHPGTSIRCRCRAELILPEF